MERVTAFKVSNKLYHSARVARGVEFNELLVSVGNNLPVSAGVTSEVLSSLADCLRRGLYNPAADKFLEAADYLRQYRAVLTGAKRDEMEVDE